MYTSTTKIPTVLAQRRVHRQVSTGWEVRLGQVLPQDKDSDLRDIVILGGGSTRILLSYFEWPSEVSSNERVLNGRPYCYAR